MITHTWKKTPQNIFRGVFLSHCYKYVWLLQLWWYDGCRSNMSNNEFFRSPPEMPWLVGHSIYTPSWKGHASIFPPSLPIPVTEIHPHSTMLSTYLTVGMVLIQLCSRPGIYSSVCSLYHEVWRWFFSLQRSLSHKVRLDQTLLRALRWFWGPGSFLNKKPTVHFRAPSLVSDWNTGVMKQPVGWS